MIDTTLTTCPCLHMHICVTRSPHATSVLFASTQRIKFCFRNRNFSFVHLAVGAAVGRYLLNGSCNFKNCVSSRARAKGEKEKKENIIENDERDRTHARSPGAYFIGSRTESLAYGTSTLSGHRTRKVGPRFTITMHHTSCYLQPRAFPAFCKVGRGTIKTISV